MSVVEEFCTVSKDLALDSLDPENPSPRCIFREHTAQNGTQNAAHGDGCSDDRCDPGPEVGGCNFWEDNHGDREQARSPDTLECAADDESRHVLAESTSEREGEKDDKRRNEGVSSAGNIAHAGEIHGASKEGQGVGEGNPVDVSEVIKFLADGVEAGRNDGRVYHGHEETQADADADKGPSPYWNLGLAKQNVWW